MSDAMLMRRVAHELNNLPHGMRLRVTSSVLDRIGCAQLQGMFGPTWKPHEWVLENVIGSAYSIDFVEDHKTGDITFSRLEHETNRPIYISPDRR